MSDGIVNDLVNAVCTISHEWEDVDKNVLPWRTDRTPYRVFLAELLLVRTRTDVVAALFEDVVAEYPDVYALAEADERRLAEILRPLGLKKRIPYIIKAARYIRDRFGGRIPSTVEQLKEVPGIGDYTAVAIAAFAYGLKSIPADVNILRFFSRFAGLHMDHPTKGSQQLRRLVTEVSQKCDCLSVEKVLDFTRKVCRPRNPLCTTCPLKERCRHARSIGRAGI